MTQAEQSYLIQQWTIEIYTWLNRARAYVAQESSLMEKLSKNTQDIMRGKNQALTEALKNRRVAKKLINNQIVLRDGYILLNKIGEIIRGEEIKYSITVSKTGEALSTGIQGTGGVYTWVIPLSQFINLLSFTSRRIVLKDSSSIYKMIEKQIESDPMNTTYEKWSEEKLQSYALFAQQVRGVAHGKWQNVNEGNILESFFRFLDRGNSVKSNNSNREYWHNVASTIKQTMVAPDPFFKGGDLNDLQIKGLNASVTNINTLIQNLEKVLNILRGSQPGFDILRKHVKTNFIDQFEKDVEKSQINITNKLVDFFVSKIDRSSITTNNVDIDFD